jgi:predicted ribosome quality control (RQC) complex YloA/Tae2 family protein
LNIHNCFVLESIAKALNKRLKDEVLLDCFSNSINELTLQFQYFQMRCIFFEGYMYFDFSSEKIGKNRLYKPQFQELNNQKINQVIVHPFERSFHIEFNQDLELFFKCHGRKSNVILYEKNDNISVFKNNIESDENIRKEEIYKVKNISFQADSFDKLNFFEKNYPYLPNVFFDKIKFHPSEKEWKDTILKFQSIQGFDYDENTLELIPRFDSGNLFKDISDYTQFSLKKLSFDKQKNQLILNKTKLLKEKQAYLKSNSEALENIEKMRNDEEIGHIILSNFHLIQPDKKEQLLLDIYNNNNILIKYDPKLSPAENADKYFKKSKGVPYTKKILKEKIEKAEIIIQKLQKELNELATTEHHKQLKNFNSNNEKIDSKQELPYKFFQFDNYDILVGKHAESNEKLLNYYSDKNDIWLHAKDVGGSHVLIKVKKGVSTPDKILEKAASLAAYYSKNRNQSLVTVMYTLRKFVRKIKGAEKGKVTVSNEKSILVKPSNH